VRTTTRTVRAEEDGGVVGEDYHEDCKS